MPPRSTKLPVEGRRTREVRVRRSLTALGRYGEAEDVAAAVAHLAGPGGRYVTGTRLVLDGGSTT
ncbi:SDR family oxidoreductase [Kitasatospora nipponensis]|uniref:SDR family oxidoreductase n=1 Tax=Kitasatospora nipponensis TaxID=258049 RepID=UPI003CD09F54